MQLSGGMTMCKPMLMGAVLAFAAAGLPGNFAHAAGKVGLITHLSGLLTVKRADGTSKVLSVKSEVQEGDTLSTEQETYARVKFADNGEVVLRPGSQLKVESYAFDQAKPESDNVFLNMLKGGMRAVTGLIGKRSRNAVNVATATATIGIRGTHWGMLMCQNDCGGVPTAAGTPPPNGLHLDVTDGSIVVSNGAGQVQLNAGQFGFVGGPNTRPAVVPPQQGIQVTMPMSISRNAGAGRGVGKAKEAECAVQ
ncbi:MAG: FecR domain-containing protein [Betaproteobacteria bacterium]|nr:FecR domain-containing protein [Betaproteobacteria bacterium]